ncbi:kinase-like domain-containing protein [Lineolata rhizophorae]|uniref:Kinase-like domain-containing protein n=1 Tax=Lineolata rhizophorae TaxID=578093 RepID=A0A6A6PDL9_9PEZI|nr:kinase-like domain-containing protein [Lineolata rhizophorae]
MDVDSLNRTANRRRAEEWAKTLTRAAIRKLASSFNDNKNCTLGHQLEGSYNLSFPVHFGDGKRWLIRFPVPGKVMCLEEKLRSEIATMKLVKERTNLKVPAIIGWGFSGGSHPTGSAFILMEYLDGQPLGFWKIAELSDEKRSYLLHQLADIMLSLSDLRFDRIGSLTLDDENRPVLKNRPLSLAQDGLIQDGVNISKIMPANRTFSSADKYAECLSRIIRARLEQQRNSIYDVEDGEQKACARYLFESIINTGLQGHRGGPFVLIHGDFRRPNILINPNTFDITGVVDWEWARIVPVQLALPPFWLTDLDVKGLAESDTGPYFAQCRMFIDCLRQHEVARPNDERRVLLSETMENMIAEQSRFWIAMCLVYPYDFDTIYWEQIDPKRRPAEQTEEEQVAQCLHGFHAEEIGRLVQRKMCDLEDYRRQFYSCCTRTSGGGTPGTSSP